MQVEPTGGLFGTFRLIARIVPSTAIVFALMYPDTRSSRHVWFNKTRLWMALYMGGAIHLCIDAG